MGLEPMNCKNTQTGSLETALMRALGENFLTRLCCFVEPLLTTCSQSGPWLLMALLD